MTVKVSDYGMSAKNWAPGHCGMCGSDKRKVMKIPFSNDPEDGWDTMCFVCLVKDIEMAEADPEYRVYGYV